MFLYLCTAILTSLIFMKHTLALFAILILLAFNANSQKFAILSDIHVTPVINAIRPCEWQ